MLPILGLSPSFSYLESLPKPCDWFALLLKSDSLHSTVYSCNDLNVLSRLVALYKTELPSTERVVRSGIWKGAHHCENIQTLVTMDRKQEGLDYDVIIIGAGISGINFAYRLQERNPELSYCIVEERHEIGGTWSLFQYPGKPCPCRYG
jgi:hypothetical protein